MKDFRRAILHIPRIEACQCGANDDALLTCDLFGQHEGFRASGHRENSQLTEARAPAFRSEVQCSERELTAAARKSASRTENSRIGYSVFKVSELYFGEIRKQNLQNTSSAHLQK